jgi:outer membrane lipoprotein SlyB
MLVNTNDAFSGLDAMPVDGMAVGDVLSIRSIAYDAGTEADSEQAATIPGPAGGGEGFNAVRDDQADQVSMHSGVVSGDDGFATSDLTEQHRFDNPIAHILIVRTD